MDPLTAVIQIARACISQYTSFRNLKSECRAFQSSMIEVAGVLQDVHDHNPSIGNGDCFSQTLRLLQRSMKEVSDVLRVCSIRHLDPAFLLGKECIIRLERALGDITEALSILQRDSACRQDISQDICIVRGKLADLAKVLSKKHHRGTESNVHPRVVRGKTYRNLVSALQSSRSWDQEQTEPASDTELVEEEECKPQSPDIDARLTCPISFEIMEDPVVLAANGLSYDRSGLCKWLLRCPHRDPTGKEYDHPLEFFPNITLRGIIMDKFGDAAYVPHDDSKFATEYQQRLKTTSPGRSSQLAVESIAQDLLSDLRRRRRRGAIGGVPTGASIALERAPPFPYPPPYYYPPMQFGPPPPVLGTTNGLPHPYLSHGIPPGVTFPAMGPAMGAATSPSPTDVINRPTFGSPSGPTFGGPPAGTDQRSASPVLRGLRLAPPFSTTYESFSSPLPTQYPIASSPPPITGQFSERRPPTPPALPPTFSYWSEDPPRYDNAVFGQSDVLHEGGGDTEI